MKSARLRCWQPIAFGLGATLLGSVVASSAMAGQVQQITNFGTNPTGIGMYLYTPATVAAKPAVLVGVHACHGKGTDVCAQGGGWVAQADKYGFLLICPSAVSADGCWDVHSTADLTHNGGGDASGIIAMINYALQNKNGDSNRVFVAGHSSGGMMTNVLIGSYPDVFKAGASFAGVPFGCYAVGSVDSLGWNASCATGNVTETGLQWGDTVRAAFPAFAQVRPRIQLWHGTGDAIVNFHNFGEAIKEWTNVLGVSVTPTSTENDAIQATWIRTRYTDASGVVQVEAIQETGQPHNLVVDQAEAIRFFGLDGTSVFPDAGAGDGAADARVGADESGTEGGADGSAAGSGNANGASGAASGGMTSGPAQADAGEGSIPAADAAVDSTMGGNSSGSAGSAASGAKAQGSDAPAGGCAVGRFTGTVRAPWPFWLLILAGGYGRARWRRTHSAKTSRSRSLS